MATPMQEQYNSIKEDYPEDIVLFRLGDFYEAFNDDAEKISQVLGITLTGRGKGENRIPMAGIPFHALDNYLPKLLKSGLKVALVEQTTEPEAGKIVEREVTKVYTPGTLTEENALSESRNNYLVSITGKKIKSRNIIGVAMADVSTGRVQVFESSNLSSVKLEISRLDPAEVIVSQKDLSLSSMLWDGSPTIRDEQTFEYTNAYSKTRNQLGTTNLKGFGIEEMEVGISALGALISYLEDCQKSALKHIKHTSKYPISGYMELDESTVNNLELLYPSSGDDTSATVYSVLNMCYTNMGKRKLREWLLRPLIQEQPLQERWDAVEYFFNKNIVVSSLRDTLKMVSDIERIVGRIGVGSANAKDLVSLKESLKQIDTIIDLFKGEKLPARAEHLVYQLRVDEVNEVINLIEDSIEEDPPASITEGYIIKAGYNNEVDKLRALRKGGKDTLAQIQQRESARTGIPSLKVSFNKVFGYYIEVTNTHSDKVPDEYIRKQTLTNSERFITQELKDWEDKILTAEDKLVQLEYDLFVEIRNQLADYATSILNVADSLAELDVLANFGYLSRQNRFAKPSIDDKTRLVLKASRHLVVEAIQEEFTPNDIEFRNSTEVIILTGPNMSGKSTYIRQAALMVLLAQIGCFVPADEMRFRLVDRIFTRVGASDNLSKGESTFMVEMSESANILNNATENSLIILDEVSRGTSTYDGVAIAWAMVEHIAEKLHSTTLFATHYHELIELEKKYTNIKNYNVDVVEENGNVLFRHKIIRGSTNKSYGIYVAKMAGVPEQITTRAANILDSFESGEDKNSKRNSGKPKSPKKIAPEQLGLI